MYLLSTIITLNIEKYIRVLLKLFLPLQIYKQPLDCLNLTYIISSIHKTELKNLDFFILSEGIVGKILKTIIFVEKIDNVI